MKRLTAQLKQALAALACADAGEMLTGSEKDRVLRAGDLSSSFTATATATATAAPAPPPPAPRPGATLPPPAVSGLFAGRKQVGLYLGASLDQAVLRYAADTCRQLDAALTVITFQSEDGARALLEPYLAELGRDGVVWRIARLRGEPRTSLLRFVKGESRMLFLVANEAGFLGHSLLSGVGRRIELDLPIVLVATDQVRRQPEPRAVAGR